MKYLLILVFSMLVIFQSCKEDDDKPTISATNFTTTIDENPTSGQSLGTIQYSGEGYNNISISFDPENTGLAEYLNLNRSTGELTVSNPAYFDFEQRTIASGNGKIEVFNSNDDMASANFTITINIRDVDEQGGGGNNPLSIQFRLDSGESPIQIYNSNHLLLDSLYGKIFEGGIIAYLDTTSGSGFVVAPYDISTTMVWDPNPPSGGFLRTNDTLKTIGSGSINTIGIVSDLGMGTYAAKACDDLVLNSRSDWFLPSLEEQRVIWKNLHSKGKGNFSNDVYWTSTETSSNANQAWKSDFSNPSVFISTGAFKDYAYLVRAARAF